MCGPRADEKCAERCLREQKKDKDKIYKLKFEDDDDRVCDVLVESIVEQP